MMFLLPIAKDPDHGVKEQENLVFSIFGTTYHTPE